MTATNVSFKTNNLASVSQLFWRLMFPKGATNKEAKNIFRYITSTSESIIILKSSMNKNLVDFIMHFSYLNVFVHLNHLQGKKVPKIAINKK